MNTRSIDALTEYILDQAVDIWHDDGYVVSALWVSGPVVLFALPADEVGLSVTSEAKVGFHALMALAARARFVGRVDQTLARVRDDADGPITLRDMESVIDIDPAIHTAIGVESLELSSMTNLLKIARLELDNEGRPTWVRTTHPDPGDMTVPDVRMCGVMINDPSRAEREARLPSVDDVEELLRDLHWRLIRSKPPAKLRR